MKYAHVLSRLYNTPLLLEESKLQILTDEVTLKLLTGEPVGSLKVEEGFEQTKSDSSSETFAVIRVHGSLVSHNGAGDSGVRSYTSISNDISYAISKGAKTLVFSVKSYGGEADGNFGLCNFIASLPQKYGVKTIGIADGPACSGGYTILASCQEVLATTSSTIGSIGVIATLIDQSEKDKKDGIKYEFIRSADEKALLTGHEPLTSKVKTSISEKVLLLDKIMKETVNSIRPKVSMETMTTLKGKAVLGEEALALGLIDRLVPSYDMALDEIFTKTSPIAGINRKGNFMTLEEENLKLKEELTSLKADNKVAVSKAIAGERERVVKIMEAGKTFGMSSEAIAKRISVGTSYEDSVDMFESIKEAVQIANPTPQAPGVTGTLAKETDGNQEASAIDNFLIGLKALQS